MRDVLALIPCLVAPPALAGRMGRVVAVAYAEPAPARLTGPVPARGRTTAAPAAEISARLRCGFIGEPSVAAEIESDRPCFILGEVAAPGQYPYLPNMTARFVVPSGIPLSSGDTVLAGERGL
jgi:polysaccharide biosynthesis/export protein